MLRDKNWNFSVLNFTLPSCLNKNLNLLPHNLNRQIKGVGLRVGTMGEMGLSLNNIKCEC